MNGTKKCQDYNHMSICDFVLSTIQHLSIAPTKPCAYATRSCGRSQALEKIRRQSWADYTPLLSAQIQPFFQHPSTLTTPETGWQAMLILTFPLLEGGLRLGQLAERKVLVEQARDAYAALVRQTNSELRVGTLAAVHADEALAAANTAAQLAHETLSLANLAYESGATTNIEVIDAERRARDADAAAAVAEDALRQARLDLLAAAGQFP
jgi:outer membrane protein TolC